MTTDATFIYAFMSFVQSACACPTRWRTIAPSLTTGCLHKHTKPLLSVNFPGTTQRSAQHQQDMHSAHTTAHAVTRRVHVASFHAFLLLLLPVSSSCFCFPNPLCLVFMLQKVRKRMLKIAHVFQLEMWITPKSLLFSGSCFCPSLRAYDVCASYAASYG